MIIYKEKVEAGNVPFYASMDLVQFNYDGHNELCIWFMPNDLKVEYMAVGTGWEFDDCWVPTKMIAVSQDGFVLHLLKRR